MEAAKFLQRNLKCLQTIMTERRSKSALKGFKITTKDAKA